MTLILVCPVLTMRCGSELFSAVVYGMLLFADVFVIVHSIETD